MKQILIVGDELDQTTDVPDYPPSEGWTLYYRLIPRVSGTPILLTGIATSDDKHRHIETSSATAAWVAGEYSCFAWVTQASGAMYTVDPETGVPGNTSIVVTLQADPRTVTAYDGRSPARKALDAIDSGLQTYGTNAHVLEYTIGNRSMRFKDQADLLVTRDRLKAEVWREEETARVNAGLPGRRNLHIRMARV